jgi:hypothetical protein
MNIEISNNLEQILIEYSQSFENKIFPEESLQEDDLMNIFGLTQIIKLENKQYWGRELGMCWQRLVTELCKQTCPNFSNSIRQGRDEICDLVIGKDAIDTKYRIGSGDSGTLKKFKSYGEKLQQLGFNPILLIVRNDNLPQAIKACENGGWIIKCGDDTYDYLQQITNFDLKLWLQNRKNYFSIS